MSVGERVERASVAAGNRQGLLGIFGTDHGWSSSVKRAVAETTAPALVVTMSPATTGRATCTAPGSTTSPARRP
jgi:hypothetical protein